mmetsp:Transcript_20244/g.41711  ORF Transcript_20244/g.41711 Transcript_20244/m.41711 type:complete len:265 (+) Transcript_20244:102-896(+)
MMRCEASMTIVVLSYHLLEVFGRYQMGAPRRTGHKARTVDAGFGLVFRLNVCHELLRAVFGNQRDRATPKATPGESASIHARKALGNLHEGVNLIAAHLVVVPHTGMAPVHQFADLPPVALFQSLPGTDAAIVFGHHVFRSVVFDLAHEFLGVVDVLECGVSQHFNIGIHLLEGFRSRLALGDPDRIFSSSDAVFDVGIRNHQDRQGILRRERCLGHFRGSKAQCSAIDQHQTAGGGRAADGLVHDPTGRLAPIVFGLLAAQGP